MPDRKPTARGELRRRHRAWLTSGAMAALGSEGRLIACYVIYWADFEKCTLKLSIRGASKVLGVRPNSVRRGVEQMIEAGVLAVVSKGAGSQRSQYEITYPPGHATCALRSRVVTGGGTLRDRSAHATCPERTRSVYGAHTLRDPYSNISIGIQGNTNREIQLANPPGSAGEEPADRAQAGEGQASFTDIRADALQVASEDTLTEEVEHDRHG